MKKSIFYFLSLFVMLSIKISAQKTVIAYRGASGYLPEHVLESKAMAYAMGVDYLEQDVVLTKDDIAIVHHDLVLDYTTNVAEIYPRKKRKNGKYYVIDFDWKELQRLKVIERKDPDINQAQYSRRFPLGKSAFGLHTLAEEIEMIQGLNKSTGKNVGIYVEIKSPKFHKEAKKDISKIVLGILKNHDYYKEDSNCYVQSFDADELIRIKNELKSNLKLIQLYKSGYEDAHFKGKSAQELVDEISTYAKGISVWYKILTNEKYVDIENITEFVKIAHDSNLIVHVFTLRADDIGSIYTFNEVMIELFTKLRVDGAFTDHPDKVIDFLKKNQ